MKLSDYAREKGICYRTAYNWFKKGMIPEAYQMPNGTILLDQSKPIIEQEERIVTYSRVSNANRRNELQYQVKRISDFCAAKGWSVSHQYYEVASGMNDQRKQLWRMIDSNPTTIVIENKDRLTRFGFEYIRRLLRYQGTEIVVINEAESDEQDLIRDLVSIITSLCCRLYGLRRGYKKAAKLKEEITSDQDH